MKKIPDEFLDGRNPSNPRPASIRMPCPLCGDLVVFGGVSWTAFGSGEVNVSRPQCASCRQRPLVLVVSQSLAKIDSNVPVDVFVYPEDTRTRSPIGGLSDDARVTEALKRAYGSAITAFNVRDWNGTAAHCGRVLEGIAKTLLPENESRQTLGAMLAALPKHVDLDEPILHVADVIRKGRNIGAHFDQEVETSEHMASTLLDLLDYLLEFLFLLPTRIESVQEALSSESGRGAA